MALLQPPESDPLARALAAIANRDAERFRDVLLAHDEVVEGRNSEGVPLVRILADAATSENSIPLVKGPPAVQAMLVHLLAAGADVNAAPEDGWTALHGAAMSGHDELIETLLSYGADPARCAGSMDGATPLSYALFYAHTSAASRLARPHAHPNNLRTMAALGDVGALDGFFDRTGALTEGAGSGRAFYRPLPAFPDWDARHDPASVLNEALGWAARNGQLAAMEFLVGRGASVHATMYAGTPLLWATYSARHDAIRWLVARGADPNQAHDFGGREHGKGATALHLAAQHGDVQTVELLLELGADRTIRDAAYSGTPEDWAQHCGQAAAVRRLGQAG